MNYVFLKGVALRGAFDDLHDPNDVHHLPHLLEIPTEKYQDVPG